MQARNYRMTIDVVPMASEGVFAGEVFTFQDPSLKGPGGLAKGVQQNHVIPILGEYLEGLGKEGQKLDAKQQALIKYGKQSTAESPSKDVDVRFLGKGDDVKILPGETGKAIAAPAAFSGVMANAVANNLIYNLMKENIKKDLQKITVNNLTYERLNLALRKIAGRVGAMKPRELKLTIEAKKVIMDYTMVYPGLPNTMLEAMSAKEKLIPKSIATDPLFKYEGMARFLDVLLAVKTGDFSNETAEEVLKENRLRILRDLPTLWYTEHPQAVELYKQVAAKWEFK